MADENFVIQVVLKARDSMAGAFASANKSMGGFRNEARRAQTEMRNLDRSAARTEQGMGKLGSRLDEVRGKVNAIRGPTSAAAAALRGFGTDVDRSGTRLGRLNSRLHETRTNLSQLTGQLRGMGILLAASQFQALTSAALGLSGALTGLAGSALSAGAALGGALAAGAAQAIPALGLLAASVARLKAVFDVVDQAQKAQQATATQATPVAKDLADANDRIADSLDGVRDAHQRVNESQRQVNEARREAKRDLQDLILAERGASLGQEEAEARLRQLNSTGQTGFARREAELDLDQANLEKTRSRQDLNRAQTQLAPGIRDARRSLRDAQEGLVDARRGLANARRDVAEGGAATVAAGRQLDYLQAQLTQSERRLVKSITNLKDTWKEVSRPITDTIVNAFTDAVDRTEKVIQKPSLINAFKGLADEGAKQFGRITDVFLNDRGVAFFERSTRRLKENLQPATTAAVRLSRAFMNIADAAGPTLHRMVEDVARLAGRMERVTENDRGMRELFRFGYENLKAWLNLAKSIGEVIKAIVAPGGDLDSGAGASGMRTLVDLTERFTKAAKYLNENPVGVDKFFKESEVIFQRILELVIEIGKALFEIMDPDSVDAFADIIEDMIPPLQMVAEVMGTITRLFADFLQIPGIKQAIQGAFGFALLVGLFGRLKILFAVMFGTLTKVALTTQGILASITSMPARIAAGTAAWRNYGAAAAIAGAQARAAGAVPVGGAAGARGAPVVVPRGAAGQTAAPAGYGRNPAIFGPGAAAGAAAGGAAASRFAGIRGAFAGTGPILALTAALSAATAAFTTPGGARDRARAAASGATFGAVQPGQFRAAADSFNQFTTGKSPVGNALRGALQSTPGLGGIPAIANLLGSSEDDKKAAEAIKKAKYLGRELREAFSSGNEKRVEEIAAALRKVRAAASDAGADKVVNGIKALQEAIKDFRATDIRADDILNEQTVNKAIANSEKIRSGVFSNMRILRREMKENWDQIGRGAAEGTGTWRALVIDNFGAGVTGIRKAMREGTVSTKDGMEEIRHIVRRQMTFVRNNMDDLSNEAKEKLAANFRNARIAVTRQAGGIENATGNTLRFIKKLMRQELELYGFTPEQARNVAQGQRFDGGGNPQGSNTNKATGGFIGKPGERGADRDTYRLGRGEAVLNWAHQRMVEPAMHAYYGSGLPEMFKRTRTWHAGMPGGGLGKGGLPDTPRGGFPDADGALPGLDALAWIMKQKFGLQLMDGSRPAGTRTSTGGISDHSWGGAIDISNGGSPTPQMDAAARYLSKIGGFGFSDGMSGAGGPIKQMLYRTSTGGNHFNHIHVALQQAIANSAAQAFRIFSKGGSYSVADIKEQRKKIGKKQYDNFITLSNMGGDLGNTAQAGLVGVREAALNTLKRAAEAAAERDADAGGGSGPGSTGVTNEGSVAAIIYRVAKQMNVPGKHLLAAIATGIVESGLKNLSGGDADSVGWRQERGHYGSVEERMNVAHGAERIFREMRSMDEGQSAGELAADVQRPAEQYRGRYGENLSEARAIIRKLGGYKGVVKGAGGGLFQLLGLPGFAAGGIVPGGGGEPRHIMAHAGEWILNKKQQMRAAAMAGTEPDDLRNKLGFTGGPKNYQGGGIIVGDSIAHGMDKFFKKAGWRIDTVGGRNSPDTLDALKRMLAKKDTKEVIFDAGTNDGLASVLRNTLKGLFRATGKDTDVILTTVAGGSQQAGEKNKIIREFAERFGAQVFNSSAFARKKGINTDSIGHYPSLGAYGARARALRALVGGGGQIGGNGEGGGGADVENLFALPDILPDSFKGYAKLINDFFTNIKKLKGKTEKNMREVNANLDLLTQEGGLLDSMATVVEEQKAKLGTKLLRNNFNILSGGRVVKTSSEVDDIDDELALNTFEGRALNRTGRFIARGMFQARRNIRRLRDYQRPEARKEAKELQKDIRKLAKGKEDADERQRISLLKQERKLRRQGISENEEEEFATLIGQRRALERRRAANRGSQAERVAARFELQGRRIQAVLDERMRPFAQGLANIESSSRVNTAFGRGNDVNLIDQQRFTLAASRTPIMKALYTAAARGQTALADQYRQQLLDIDTQLQELVAQRLQAQADLMERAFSRQRAAVDFRDRMAGALGTIGLDRIIPGLGATRRQGFDQRQGIISAQITGTQTLLNVAAIQGNTAMVDTLTNALYDLKVELAENSRALFLARIEEVNRRLQIRSGQTTARSRIAELQAELGIITGPQSQEQQRAQAESLRQELLAQNASLFGLLGEARTRGDEEQIIVLEQAMLDNTIALLENSKTIKDLDGTLNQTQSFSSTAWQWMRTAIFNGSGGLLPNFNQFGSPFGGGSVALAGTASAPTTGVPGAGQNINVNVNEAGSVPDPVYLGNRIALAVKTPGT